MKQEVSFVTMDESLLKNKTIFMNYLGYLTAYSEYDYAANQRIIDKNLLLPCAVTKCTKNVTAYMCRKIKNILIEENFLIYDEDNGYYIVPQPKEKFVKIDTKLLRKLIYNFDSNIVQVFLYLKNENNKRNGQYRFSYTELATMLGYCPNTDRIKIMQSYVNELELHNLIKFHTVHCGNTFYRQIDFIGDDFIGEEPELEEHIFDESQTDLKDLFIKNSLVGVFNQAFAICKKHGDSENWEYLLDLDDEEFAEHELFNFKNEEYEYTDIEYIEYYTVQLYRKLISSGILINLNKF